MQLGAFQALNGVGAACVWVSTAVSVGLVLLRVTESRVQRAVIVATWFTSTAAAFALYLVSLRLVLSSELLQVRVAAYS